MTLANWVKSAIGVDPGHALRSTYRDGDWSALVEKEGGLVPLVDRLAVSVGLIRTDTPLPGDIGVVQIAIGPIGAIKVSRGWAVKMRDGMVARPLPMLAAWSVG